MPAGQAARLFVGFEGPAVEVQWMLDALRDQWQASGIASPMTVTNTWARLLWDWLADFPADVQISVRPGELTKMIGALVALDPDCTIQAHAGNGILHVIFSPQNPRKYQKPTARTKLHKPTTKPKHLNPKAGKTSTLKTKTPLHFSSVANCVLWSKPPAAR